MRTQTASIARWVRLMWGLALTLLLFGWSLVTPPASESGTFSFDGASVESLGDDLFRVRHVCTASGIPGVLPPGCYSGVISVDPSDLPHSVSLNFVEGDVDTPPPSTSSNSGGSDSGSSEFKVEGTITSINAADLGGVTEFTALGEGGSSGVRVQVNSTVVVFEKVPPGFDLDRGHLAQGQSVEAEGGPFDTTAGILADEVEVREVEIEGPITATTAGGTFNGTSLECILTIFDGSVQVLVPTTFAPICSASLGTIVEAEGPFVDTDGDGIADSILAGEIEGEEEEEDGEEED